ncbi:MAG: hypothetical protein MUF11_15105 [Beijerinckiaceae bacterium]|jgi:hypothetical protein|nr:hypothetical protein [Beijerinckiaceae bacterium]
MNPDPRERRLDFLFRVALVALALLWVFYPPSAKPGRAAVATIEAAR